MSKFSVDKVADIETHLSTNNYLSGAALPDANDAQIFLDLNGAIPNKESHPNTYFWYCSLAVFAEPVLRAWIEKTGKKEEKGAEKGGKAAEKKDEDVDLFGDDDEAEKEKLEKIKKDKEAEKTKKKKEVIARSIVVFSVKVFEMEQDLDVLAKKIMTIEMDGLQWRTEYKKVPVAYGMYMLQMGCTIEDDKVLTEDLFDKIQAWEDEVQSVDIDSFQKV